MAKKSVCKEEGVIRSDFSPRFSGGRRGSAVTLSVCTGDTPDLWSEYQKDIRILVMKKEIQRHAHTVITNFLVIK